MHDTRESLEGQQAAAFSSAEYWEKRYANGGNSGAGSRGALQLFKGDVIADFIHKNTVNTIIDWGCGDGHQLQAITRTNPPFRHYTGIDVSKTAIEMCKKLSFNGYYFNFITIDEYKGEQAELALSLDVIYHLTEDDVFDAYMKQLCDSSTKYLVIYSSDGGKVLNPAIHLKERCFTRWIEENRPEWRLTRNLTNIYPYKGGLPLRSSISDFYFYSRDIRD